MADKVYTYIDLLGNVAQTYDKNEYIYQMEIPGYPKGSDLTIINTAYVPPRPIETDDITGSDYKQFTQDYIQIIYRDNNTGIKHDYTIKKPKRTWFLLKDEYIKEASHNFFFIEKEKVKPITCTHRSLYKSISEHTYDEKGRCRIDYFDPSDKAGNAQLHRLPEIFMTDMDIQNYYRFQFGNMYKNSNFQLKKSYLDIEVDGRYSVADFPLPGEVPINAVSFLDAYNGISYQFLLENYENPLIQEYENKFINDYQSQYNKLKDFIVKAVGGPSKARKYGVDKLEYRIVFFDDELSMLRELFRIINEISPDILYIWNMAFDLTYIYERLKNLGVIPEDIICDPRIQDAHFKFFVDERNKNDFEERGDYVSMSSYTVWLDQMIQFASRRKGRGKYPSFKLDSIGEIIAGVNKLDYSHITTNIDMLPYLNYEIFSFYNIMDTIVQMCIESVTQDAEYVFTKCLVNNTIYPKAHRQSVYLTNRFTKDFYEAGYIIGNNKNKWNDKPELKFPGAMVGDPFHNSEKALMKINGRSSMMCENMVDFDYSSLYPSIILENNLAMNTQIGKFEIEEQVHNSEHPDMYVSDDDDARYSRSGEFFDNLMSGNVLETCRRWFGLGNIHDVIKDIIEYFEYNLSRGETIRENKNNPPAVYFTKPDHLKPAVTFDDEYNYSGLKPAVTFENEIDDTRAIDLEESIKKEAIL